MEALAILYVLGTIVALVFLVILFWAPIKLYAIHRELVKLNKEAHIQTRMLASIMNALVSTDSRSIEEKLLLGEREQPKRPPDALEERKGKKD